MNTFLHPSHPARCIITGPSDCCKSNCLKNSKISFVTKFEKIYTNSTSLNQDFQQKISKCFSNFIRLNAIPNFLNEQISDLVTDAIVNDKDFEKSETEKETFESKEKLKYPQEFDADDPIFFSDDIHEKETNDPRVQAMFRWSRHNNKSIFIISLDYYELPKNFIRANDSICSNQIISEVFKSSIKAKVGYDT